MTQQKNRRDSHFIAGAAVTLAVIAIVGVLLQPAPPAPALSVRSDDADGALALRLWLDALHYETRELTSDPLVLNTVSVLFVLNPLLPYSPGEIEMIAAWVRDGGTLIATGRPRQLNGLLEPFDLSLSFLPDDTLTHALASPTLRQPPVNTIRSEAIYTVNIERRADSLVHVSEGRLPVLVSINEGDGVVWVSGALRPFTNRGLHDDDSARLLLNLVGDAPRGAVVGFDETRHGFGDAPRSLFGWLVTSAPGWGIITLLLLTGVFLTLRGRRFGAIVPLPEQRLRRESVEYIRAIASLYRRSGQRDDLLAHYRDQFRRRLSERYSVDPRLNDSELVAAVIYRDADIDETELRDLLTRLSARQISENELVETAMQADQWLRRLT